MDALSDLARVVAVEASFFSRAQASGRWGVSTRGAENAIFHAVLRGRGVASAAGGVPVAFGPGDLLLFPRGSSHVIASDDEAPRTPITALPRVVSESGLPCVVAGVDRAAEPEVDILCGTFRFDADARACLLPQLPELVHAPAAPGSAPWLVSTAALLDAELRRGLAGADVLLSRLGDVLMVQILRGWLAQHEAPGWVGALADPVLARVLGLVHAHPERDWTAAELARRAGMSRSAFFAYFTARVGEPPAAYLLRWRMWVARRFLRDRRRGVAEVGRTVGYASEAAFSRAFKRAVGTAPAAWRQAA
ncbi:MAG: AraC family transcriptional regulator [Deltaproteobacteria bacterium]|nr:AraC family transcriptional regulator [Deltaproteobacteria bacterium]